MPIDHSAPPPPPPNEEAVVFPSGPLDAYFKQFMERVIEGAGEAPTDQLREGMRGFFFCGAGAVLTMVLAQPAGERRDALVRAMLGEISDTSFFRAAGAIIGVTH